MHNNTILTTTTTSLATSNTTALNDFEKVLFSTGLIFISLLSLVGNGLFILAFIVYRPLRKLTHYFIVSLAVSDILVAVVSMPVWLTYIINNMDFNIYHGVLFRVWICFDILGGIASIYNLVAVSVDRYLHIFRPFEYVEVVTKTRIIFTIIGIWLFASSMAFLKGFVTWHPPQYQTLVFVMGFALPAVVIIYCYCNIYKEVRGKAPMCTIRSPHRTSLNDIKVMKMVAIIILCFFMCWSPFFILTLKRGWCQCTIDQHLITFAKLLHYANSAFNPLIYVCCNREIRDAFKLVLHKYLSTRNSPLPWVLRWGCYEDLAYMIEEGEEAEMVVYEDNHRFIHMNGV